MVHDDKIPNTGQVDLIYNDAVVSTQFEITRNILGRIDVDVLVENLPVEISGKSGIVDMVFTIYDNENGSTERVSVERWSNELDGALTELQEQLVDDWNR